MFGGSGYLAIAQRAKPLFSSEAKLFPNRHQTTGPGLVVPSRECERVGFQSPGPYRFHYQRQVVPISNKCSKINNSDAELR